MPKFIILCSYSPGSWARMMRSIDDRVATARKLTECLGGSLDCVYWEVSTRAAYAITDMPDSTSAAAAAAVLTHTGAFKSVETHEVLTQDQLCHMLTLAADAAKVYQVPGQRQPADDTIIGAAGSDRD